MTDRKLGMTFAEIREANARLIEQRDELLAALTDVADGYSPFEAGGQVSIARVREVLAKYESGATC